MSILFNSTTRYMMPLLLLFSIFLLLRGHNEPGGGFVGGLVGTSALAFYAIAYGERATHQLLVASPRQFIVMGLAVALVSGIAGLILEGVFLAGIWGSMPIPVLGKLGTPFVFDVGVYMTVIGVTLTILFALMEE